MFEVMVTRLHQSRPFPVARRKLTESEHGFDDAENRLRPLFARGVEIASLLRLRPTRHRLDRRLIEPVLWASGEAPGQRRMVRLPAHCDHRVYARFLAGVDGRDAEIAVSVSNVSVSPSVSGKAPSLSSVGSIYCLSLDA